MCMRSVECKTDVRCSADDSKTAGRILIACAVRAAMLQNEQNQPLFYSPWIARASSIVRKSDLEQIRKGLGNTDVFWPEQPTKCRP